MSNIKLEAEAGAVPNVIPAPTVKYEDITKANELISTTDIKGKNYAEVNQRVKAFRCVYPQGTITTEILSNDNGVVIMKATARDEQGKVIGTGMAYEKENGNFINKTSYIENCETSAVGRALGFCGFGIDTSICSAEELNNAINNQDNNKKSKDKDIDDKDRYDKILFNYCKENNINVNEVAKEYKLNGKSTNDDYKKAYEEIKATDKKDKK